MLLATIAFAISLVKVAEWQFGVSINQGPATAYTEVIDGEPLRWHTCATVPVLINPGPAGDDGFAEIAEAVGIIARETGIQFEISGRSNRVPTLDWSRNGTVVGTWPYPAVLIAWTENDSTDLLNGRESASAVGNPAAYQDLRQIVTGAVALDASELDNFTPGFGPGRTRGNLILHELGHVIGLQHVKGRRLMNPVVGPHSPAGFTSGEIEGLRAISPRCTK